MSLSFQQVGPNACSATISGLDEGYCSKMKARLHAEPALDFIDLFAGCGGLALGFLQQGFRPVAAVEWDGDAAETYATNIHSQIEALNITSVPHWPMASIVLGGPPCQGFSPLGARNPDDPRNRLWREYVRVLDDSSADIFVMENVPQLLASTQFDLFRRAVVGRGFKIVSAVLNAADYGVPQTRRRAIVIGSRFGEPFFPEKTHGPLSPSGAPYQTVRNAWTASPQLAQEPTGVNWHDSRPKVRADSVLRYIAVPKDGGNRFQMQANLEAAGRRDLVPKCWLRKRTGTTDVFGRLWWDRPSVTVRTEFFKPEKGRYLHPAANRAITVREAARLQTFPDSFVFPEGQSMGSVARQIGNAVPPLLASALAMAIHEHLAEHGRLEVRNSAVSRRQLQLIG
jgi:DNA (cytosine-5)-methyltransferase 1